MVVPYEMTDKQSQQRQGRDDGANRSVADRNAMEEDRALAPETTQASPRWPALDREPPGGGGDSLDPADWCSLAGSAGEYPHPSTCWRRLRDWEVSVANYSNLAAIGVWV